MCARCEELEERVAWLESELGLQIDLEAHRRLRVALKGKRPGSSNTGTGATLIAVLYAARGRPLSKLQILEAIPSPSGLEERNAKIVDVWVHVARMSLGREAIETIWGRGYRMTPQGMAKVALIIGAAPAEDAA